MHAPFTAAKFAIKFFCNKRREWRKKPCRLKQNSAKCFFCFLSRGIFWFTLYHIANSTNIPSRKVLHDKLLDVARRANNIIGIHCAGNAGDKLIKPRENPLINQKLAAVRGELGAISFVVGIKKLIAVPQNHKKSAGNVCDISFGKTFFVPRLIDSKKIPSNRICAIGLEKMQ